MEKFSRLTWITLIILTMNIFLLHAQKEGKTKFNASITIQVVDENVKPVHGAKITVYDSAHQYIFDGGYTDSASYSHSIRNPLLEINKTFYIKAEKEGYNSSETKFTNTMEYTAPRLVLTSANNAWLYWVFPFFFVLCLIVYYLRYNKQKKNSKRT